MNTNRSLLVYPTEPIHTPVSTNKQAAEREHSATFKRVSQLTLDLDEILPASCRHSSPGRPASPTVQIAMAIKTRRAPLRDAVPPPRDGSAMGAATFDAQKQILRTDAGIYALGELVGKGSFGDILQAIGPTGRRVVVKVIDMQAEMQAAGNKSARDAVVKKYRHEFAAMRKANAPCQPLDMAVADNKLFIVLRELRMHLGDEALRDAIAARSRPHVANCAFHDISDDLGRVHGRGWLHRDLKPENFMTDAQGNVVLIDFGEAQELGQKSQLCATSMDCSPELFAPETFLHWDSNDTFGERIDSKASEMFSLGLCWSMIATGRDTTPFENNPDVHRAWTGVHAALSVDAITGHIDIGALAAQTGGTRQQIGLREFVLRLCEAHLATGSYIARRVLHPNPQQRPSAVQASADSQLDSDDMAYGRAWLERPLACEAAKDYHVRELTARHSELLAADAASARKLS